LAHQQSSSTERRARGRVAADQPGTNRAVLSHDGLDGARRHVIRRSIHAPDHHWHRVASAVVGAAVDPGPDGGLVVVGETVARTGAPADGDRHRNPGLRSKCSGKAFTGSPEDRDGLPANHVGAHPGDLRGRNAKHRGQPRPRSPGPVLRRNHSDLVQGPFRPETIAVQRDRARDVHAQHRRGVRSLFRHHGPAAGPVRDGCTRGPTGGDRRLGRGTSVRPPGSEWDSRSGMNLYRQDSCNEVYISLKAYKPE